MTLGKREYAYSFDNENYEGCFSIPTRAYKEALAELKADGKTDATFYVGLFANGPCPPVDVDVLLENLQQTAEGSHYGGEYAEGWLDDVSKEHQEELESQLTAVFYKWMNKHGYLPTWRKLIAVDTYRVVNGHPVLIEKGIQQ